MAQNLKKRIQFILVEKLFRPYTILFLLLFVAGISLRLHELGSAPLWQAEMYNSWAGRNFLEGNGFSDPVGSSSSYTRAWITSSLPIAVSFFFMGLTEFAARLPSVVFGMATAVVGYKIAEDLMGKKAGLIFLGIFVFDLIAVTWHRQARMYAQNQFFYICGVFLLSRWYGRDKLKLTSFYPVILVPVVLLGVHNHVSFLGLGAAFFVFMFFSLFSILYRKEDFSSIFSETRVRRHVVIIAGLMASALLFLVFNGVPSWFMGYSPDWYTHSRGVFFYLNFILKNSSIYFLLGLGIFTVWDKKRLWLPSLALTVPFIVQSFFIDFKEPRMIFHLYPLIVLVAVKPLSDFLDLFSGEIYPRFEKFISIIFILLFVSVFQAPFNSFQTVSETSYGVINPKPNHRSAVNFIEDRRNSTDLVITSAPFITSWYMRNTSEIDYDLNPLNYNRTESGLYSPRLGIKGIEDGKHVKKIFRNSTGWVITDENFRTKTSQEVRNTVKANSRKVEKFRGDMIDLYRFK